MPRPSNYTPWRKMLLQAAMCLVLIGTLGLAQLVTRYKLHAGVVRLAPAVRVGEMSVRFPAEWDVARPVVGDRGAVVVRMAERARGGGPGRGMTIVREHRDVPLPPKEYLLTSGLMPADYAPTLGGQGSLGTAVAAEVAGGRGYLVAGVRPVRASATQVVLKREVFATAMLPTRDYITVTLEGFGGTGEEDVDLVRRVAAGISVPQVGQAGASAAGGVVTMGEGSTVKGLAGFEALAETDGHFTERHLVRASPPSLWSGVTVVPGVFFPGVDSAETFRTMLTARDQEWLEAKISGALLTLRADLPVRAGLPFPRRAYLLTSETGYALLVELHAGTTAEAGEWEGLLKQIAEGASPPKGPTPVELLKAGEAEVRRLRGIGLPALLEGAPGDNWWVWESGGRAVGWSHVAFDASGESCHGTMESRARRDAKTIEVMGQEFETSADFSKHSEDVGRREVRQGMPAAAAVDAMQEKTAVAGGKYTLLLAVAPAGGQVARATGAVGDAFLPGAWMPFLAGRWSNREMIFRTTRVPGLESQATTGLVSVRVRPTTRPGEFNLDVSGTGQLLTMSAGGMAYSERDVRKKTTAAEVRGRFKGDAGMVP